MNSGSRFLDVTCGYCGAIVTIDRGSEFDMASGDPEAHEEDCARVDMADPREMSSGERRRIAVSQSYRAAAYRRANGIPDAGR